VTASPILTNVIQYSPECELALVHDDDLGYIDVAVRSFITYL
jgi:hypothetical protein